MRRIAVLDAPSNLGLRPPTETSVPGCAKAPGALRDKGLLTRLHARDAGCLTPPRYDPGDWRPGDGVCHSPQLHSYTLQLADRISAIIDAGEFPLVLGGDCSILLGSALAMRRLGAEIDGRLGLVFVDGHSDFRHPGNAPYVGAAAGEDLALVTGRGQPDLAGIEGRRPYFRDSDVVVLGIRENDEYRLDLNAAGFAVRPATALRAEGASRTAQWAREQLADCAGYWLHVDVDVLDATIMPAVDAPSPGGIAFAELELLLAGLVNSPHCMGMELTVFDPDHDPQGSYARIIVETVLAGLAPLIPKPYFPSPRRATHDKAPLDRTHQTKGLHDRAQQDRAQQDRPPQDKAPLEKAAHEKAAHEKATHDRALQTKGLHDRAPQSKVPHDRAPSDKASHDKGPHKGPHNKGPHERAPQDKGLHDKGSDPHDIGPHDRGPRDRPPQDKDPHDRSPQDRSAQDKGPQDRSAQDKGPHDKGPHDKGPHDKGPHDKGPQDKGPHDKGPRGSTPRRAKSR